MDCRGLFFLSTAEYEHNIKEFRLEYAKEAN